MTTLILLRHGQTISNINQIYQGQGDGILSKKGLQQARAAAKFFSKIKIDAIFSSDLRRAHDTAKIIAKHHKVRVTRARNIRERFYGDWEGLRFSDIAKKYTRLYKLWLKEPNKARIPGAETLKDFQKRSVRAVTKIIKANKGRTVLVVAHGGTNRTILFKYLGLDLNNFWKIRQSNCCYNIIEFKKPYPKVVLMNGTSYLFKKSSIKTDVLA